MHQKIAEENMGMGMSTLKICEEIVNVDELENMLLLGGLIWGISSDHWKVSQMNMTVVITYQVKKLIRSLDGGDGHTSLDIAIFELKIQGNPTCG